MGDPVSSSATAHCHKREQSESNYECVIDQLKERHAHSACAEAQEQPVVHLQQADDPLALLEVTMNAGADGSDSDVNVLKLACGSLLHRLSSSEIEAQIG